MPTQASRHVLDGSETTLSGNLFQRQFCLANIPLCLFQLYAADLCEELRVIDHGNLSESGH
jgi:hypothetical protein